ALLRMELKVPHSSMAYLQQSQSEGYHFAENEVTHQLEQIILIEKMDEKIKHFEFRDFTVGENGSVFALFNIVLQPPEATFEHVNRELQETLSLIRSTLASSSQNVYIINLAVERQNMDKVAYSKMLDKTSGPYRWLDYQIHLFVVSALRRCDFYDCIEKFETRITPVYHHLETTHLTARVEVTVNHTMLALQRKSNLTAFLVCINAGFICESNNWMISTIALQIFTHFDTNCIFSDVCLMGRCCMTRRDGNSSVTDRARFNKSVGYQVKCRQFDASLNRSTMLPFGRTQLLDLITRVLCDSNVQMFVGARSLYFETPVQQAADLGSCLVEKSEVVGTQSNKLGKFVTVRAEKRRILVNHILLFYPVIMEKGTRSLRITILAFKCWHHMVLTKIVVTLIQQGITGHGTVVVESLNCHFMLSYAIHSLDKKRKVSTVGPTICIIEQLIVFDRALAYYRKHKIRNTNKTKLNVLLGNFGQIVGMPDTNANVGNRITVHPTTYSALQEKGTIPVITTIKGTTYTETQSELFDATVIRLIREMSAIVRWNKQLPNCVSRDMSMPLHPSSADDKSTDYGYDYYRIG
ncbi:hypothetical protein CLF_101210, partial [Clonorchis sinensis]